MKKKTLGIFAIAVAFFGTFFLSGIALGASAYEAAIESLLGFTCLALIVLPAACIMLSE